MYVDFDPNALNWEQIIKQQQILYGSGSNLDLYYRGYPYQRGIRGAGLGSVLINLLRGLVPIAKQVGRVAGKQILTTGSEVLGDLATDRPLKETLKARSVEGAENLLKKVRGSGRKRTATMDVYELAKKRKTATNGSRKSDTTTSGHRPQRLTKTRPMFIVRSRPPASRRQRSTFGPIGLI